MKKIYSILFCIFFLFTTVCSDKETRKKKMENRKKDINYPYERYLSSIQYIKDKRTGLCFAREIYGAHGYALACVPCDSIPEYLLKNKQCPITWPNYRRISTSAIVKKTWEG